MTFFYLIPAWVEIGCCCWAQTLQESPQEINSKGNLGKATPGPVWEPLLPFALHRHEHFVIEKEVRLTFETRYRQNLKDCYLRNLFQHVAQKKGVLRCDQRLAQYLSLGSWKVHSWNRYSRHWECPMAILQDGMDGDPLTLIGNRMNCEAGDYFWSDNQPG